MRSSSSATASSPSAVSASSSSSSFSASSIIQYAFLTLAAYVLAGAPLLEMLQGGSKPSSSIRTGTSTMSPQKLSEITLPDANLSCTPHSFKNVHILHRDPLVVYIEGFLNSAETSELVSSSTPLFTPSTVWTSGEERLDTAIRHSSKAPVPRSQTAQCIESRARAFQGWRPFVFIEKLWAQRYGPGGHYTYHFDWASASRSQGRISSFMVWLQDECTGGGTHFPRIEKPRGEEWCRFVECADRNEEEREGVVFKPVKGNAVYWENFRPDGTGFEESWHAGLPVLSGEKIGLNIWSWFQDGYVPEGEQAQGAELD